MLNNVIQVLEALKQMGYHNSAGRNKNSTLSWKEIFFVPFYVRIKIMIKSWKLLYFILQQQSCSSSLQEMVFSNILIIRNTRSFLKVLLFIGKLNFLEDDGKIVRIVIFSFARKDIFEYIDYK